MKVYASFVKHYEIEVEVPDDATTEEIFGDVSDEIDELYYTGTLEKYEDDERIMSIIDENSNYVWED